MTRHQQVRVLAGLLVTWAGTALSVFVFSSGPAQVPLRHVSGDFGAPATELVGRASSPLRVHLQLFEHSREERRQGFTPPKNIFVAPGAAAIVQAGDLPVGLPMRAEPEPPEPRPASIPESPDPASGLRYLGYVGIETSPGGRAVGVMAEGDELRMVREGETLSPERLVRRVTPEAVTLFDRRSQRESRLPMVELHQEGGF